MELILKLFSTIYSNMGEKKFSAVFVRIPGRNYFRIKKTNIIFIALSLFMLAGTSAQAQKLWSLEDCINYAFKNNIQVKQSKLAVKSSASDLLQSKLNFLPSFNTSATANSNWGRAVDMATYQYSTKKTTQFYMSVNGNMTLFNGLQNVNKLRRQQFEYLASKYNSDKIKNSIALNIAAAYLQILYNIEQLHNSQRQLQTTKDQVERTKKEVEVGKVARGNLLDIEAQDASDQVNLVNAQNKLMLAYLDLMQLLDLKATTKFDIQKPNLTIAQKPSLLPIAYIYHTALGIMPEIKNAEYNVKIAGASLAVARGQRSPSLSLISSYGNNYSNLIKSSNNPLESGYNLTKPFWSQMRENYSLSLGFRLSIPILNGFQVSNDIKKSRINLENTELNLTLQKNNLRKSIEQAYTDALTSYQTYMASKKSVESLREAFKYAREKFNVGMLNSTDYTIAQNKLFNAQSTLTASKYDYIFKTKILDFYLGRSLSLKDITLHTNSLKQN